MTNADVRSTPIVPSGAVLAGGPLLGRRSHSGRKVLSVTGEMTLAVGRVHEMCGRARRTLALAAAAACRSGPVVWIAAGWGQERLNGEGITEWIDPGCLLLVQPDKLEDVQWAMEETLRSGQAPLVVAEFSEPPGLTAVRRLHLAAEAGCANGPGQPVALVLTPAEGGAAGVESRWQLEPRQETSVSMYWDLTRLRDRSAPQRIWRLHGRRDTDQYWTLRPVAHHEPAATCATVEPVANFRTKIRPLPQRQDSL